MENSILKEYKRIEEITEKDNIKRYGKLFNTNFNNYFYDTGTGKVVQLDDEDYELFSALFDRDGKYFKEAFSKTTGEKQQEFLKICLEENLLRAKKPENLELIPENTSLEKLINNQVQQLVLEVTEQCNFRCKYCIYNEEFEGDRNFGFETMSIKTAKKAIDYVLEHSNDKVSITFYGGEPLLNYEVIKASIQYALENKKDKSISFSITSNVSVLTKEMADFFASVPNFSFLVSLDGPEEVQNKARVYVKNKPTFQDTMRGLKYLAYSFENSKNVLMINAVLIPPYEYDKMEKINCFFEGLNFLPDNTEIRITYPKAGSYKYEDWGRMLKNKKYMIDNNFNPLKKWQLFQACKNKLDKTHTRNIYTYSIFEQLVDIDSRRKDDEPFETFRCNGCCIPGSRKIYVKPNGDIKTCEKIGSSPTIGNIYEGINISRVQRKYIDEYKEKSIDYCSECWAINMCASCYADCYTEQGIDIEKKKMNCEALLEAYQENLSIYFSLLEEKPEVMEILQENVYSV